MSRDGSGNYGLPAGNPVTTNTVISSTWANTTLSDIGAALTQSLSKDGQTTPTANLTMGNFRLISLAAGTNRTDAVNVGQVQDNTPAVLSSIAGTGDAITAATAPAILTYATDSKFVYTPATTNTLTNPTIAIDGLTAKTITQSNGLGLWAGALVVGTPYELLYDGTNFRVQSGQLGSLLIQQASSTGFRNRFYDGNFDFWDGGTSFTNATGSSAYTANMWSAFPGTGGSPSITTARTTWTPGAEPVGMTSPVRFFCTLTQTVAATVSNPLVTGHCEWVSTFEGRSATFSVWLWTNSGTVSIGSIQAGQIFGAGGSTTVAIPVSVSWTVTTTPQRFSCRIDFPSISGKTIGTNDYIAVSIALPLSSTFVVNTTQWQIEDCPAGAPAAGLPTPYESIDYATSYLRTLRVINFPNLVSNVNGSGGGAGNAVSPLIYNFPVPMRAVPTVTINNSGGTNVTIGSTTIDLRKFVQPATCVAAGYTNYSFTLTSLDARW